MVEAARRRAAELGARRTSTSPSRTPRSSPLADASFDGALCRFGVMLVPDCVRAARELAARRPARRTDRGRRLGRERAEPVDDGDRSGGAAARAHRPSRPGGTRPLPARGARPAAQRSSSRPDSRCSTRRRSPSPGVPGRSTSGGTITLDTSRMLSLLVERLDVADIARVRQASSERLAPYLADDGSRRGARSRTRCARDARAVTRQTLWRSCSRRTASTDATPAPPAVEWREPDLNRRHHGFQPCALPTELPRRGRPVVATTVPRHVVRRVSVSIIGAPLDLGQGRRGVDMGPSAIRYAGLEERLAGVRVPRRRPRQRRDAGAGVARGRRHARALPPRDPRGMRASSPRVVADGDRGSASRSCWEATTRSDSGTLAGLAAAAGEPRGRDLDRRARRPQHAGDVTDRATSTGCRSPRRSVSPGRAFAHPGLVLPAVDPERVVLLGIRSLDPDEQELVRAPGHPRDHDEPDRPRRDRAGRRARRSSGPPAPASSTSRSTSTRSTRRSRRVSARPCRAGSPIARRTSRASSRPSRARSARSSSSR